MIRQLEEITTERRRQISAEGRKPVCSDTIRLGELLRAANLYLWHGTDKGAALDQNGTPVNWPWDAEQWDPKDRYTNVVRAGALCLAEAERQHRIGGFAGTAESKLMLCVKELKKLGAEAS